MTDTGRLAAPPASDELEVSIFGPGKGEAIAVHLGGGDWITVDSCRDQTSGRHALLQYFDQIEAEASSRVRLVVGTHAHDDHVAGLAELHAAASNAQFVTSTALTSTEFFAAVAADAAIEAQLRQSVRREYREILAQVSARGLLGDGRRPLVRAIEQRELWARPASNALPPARVLALSPSDEAITRSLRYLAEGTAKASERKRLAAGDPNEYAIALWVEVGDSSALLGADLLVGPDGCGWRAVLDSHRPATRASLHKVPHHGSPNAHHPRVWSSLLEPEVVSILAPFRAGRTPRPDVADVARIVNLSSAAYSTAGAKAPAPSKSTKRARASLQGVAQNVRDPYAQPGHVRARRRAGAQEWSVELFSQALQLG